MLIVLRKKSVALSVIVTVVFVVGYYVSVNGGVSAPVFSIPLNGKVIIVDAGHGGEDGGAVGRSGVLEKDLNLAVAKKLQGYIEQVGGAVILTRDSDISIHDEGSKTLRQKKRSDLNNRKSLIDQNQADVFISIHMNKFEQSQYKGPQVFFAANGKTSENLASSIQEQLNELSGGTRVVKQAGKDIFLLSNAKMTAVLVECGFLSNHEEEGLLKTEAYQNKLAWSIYLGIARFFENAQG